MAHDQITEVAQNAPNNSNPGLSVHAFELMEQKHPECKPTFAGKLLVYGDQVGSHAVFGFVLGQTATKNSWLAGGLGAVTGLLAIDSANHELKGRETICLNEAEKRDERAALPYK